VFRDLKAMKWRSGADSSFDYGFEDHYFVAVFVEPLTHIRVRNLTFSHTIAKLAY
jgi:hypothetical protein